MSTVEATASVGELVREAPGRARVFERFQLDYCCGGGSSLADACAQRQLDLETVIAALAELDRDPSASAPGEHDLGDASIAEVCDHIVGAHHEPLRPELERISGLLARVVAAHGSEQPELLELQRRFEAMSRQLDEHLQSEEVALFPACRALDGDGGMGLELAQLDAHADDHAEVGSALAAIRGLCGGYDMDRALCGTHLALLDALQALELELHLHIHEENNVLFPEVRARLAA